MLKFFITHSWEDIEFAKRLSDDLRTSGLEGFFDEYSIKPGDDLVARINKGLKECDVYIPILSFAALESPWCNEEINAAIVLSNQASRKGRPKIVSVLIENCVAEMPPLLQTRLYINFETAYLSALWELLEKGFGIDPSSRIYRDNMYDGPRLLTDRQEDGSYHAWWGVCQVLEFSEKDSGKTLRISVESKDWKPNGLSIEIWRGGFDGKDVANWVKNRVEVARSPQQQNPTLTWKIEPGVYTVYFVDYARAEHQLSNSNDPYWGYRMFPVENYEILYRIEIL
jgi:hypothetical protein